MDHIFGGNPAAVVIKLVIVSIIAGVTLSALGLSPLDLLESLRGLTRWIEDIGLDTLKWLLRYFFLGAIIVFPIWAVYRLIKTLAGGARRDSPRNNDERQR